MKSSNKTCNFSNHCEGWTSHTLYYKSSYNTNCMFVCVWCTVFYTAHQIQTNIHVFFTLFRRNLKSFNSSIHDSKCYETISALLMHRLQCCFSLRHDLYSYCVAHSLLKVVCTQSRCNISASVFAAEVTKMFRLILYTVTGLVGFMYQTKTSIAFFNSMIKT